MYIDLHNHLLPDVDDGVKKLEETLRSLELAVKEKIGTLCFTPHIFEGKYNNHPEKLRKVFEEVKAVAKEIKIDLHLASEVHYSSSLAEDFKKGLYIPYGKKGRYLLVELPVTVLPKGVEDGLYKLMLEGAEPIIAHPERYNYVQKNIKSIMNLVKSQIPFQVTTQAIAGVLGGSAKKTAMKLLDMGLISFVASDAHHPEKRPFHFREAVRILNNRYGHSTTRILTIENPRRILEGKNLLPVRGKKGKLSPYL